MLPPIASLSDQHQRFISVDQGRNSGIINFVINGLIVWLLTASLLVVPLWGASASDTSMGVDLLLTAFLLPALICLITSPIVARQVRAGKLPALAGAQIPDASFAAKPLLVRALFLGVVGVLLAALPLIAVLSVLGITELPTLGFVFLKAVWAGVLAWVVGPWIAWWALASASNNAIEPVSAL